VPAITLGWLINSSEHSLELVLPVAPGVIAIGFAI
jgi:hypothetical protein